MSITTRFVMVSALMLGGCTEEQPTPEQRIAAEKAKAAAEGEPKQDVCEQWGNMVDGC